MIEEVEEGMKEEDEEKVEEVEEMVEEVEEELVEEVEEGMKEEVEVVKVVEVETMVGEGGGGETLEVGRRCEHSKSHMKGSKPSARWRLKHS